MKKTDAIVKLLLPAIENKTILEVACGSADFSISASSYATDVFCIDLVDTRLDSRIQRDHIHFEVMDASLMRYPDKTFDSVFVYNALSHIEQQWEAIENECKRVLKRNGKIYIIGSWKIDISLIDSMFAGEAKWNDGFYIVERKKN